MLHELGLIPLLPESTILTLRKQCSDEDVMVARKQEQEGHGCDASSNLSRVCACAHHITACLERLAPSTTAAHRTRTLRGSSACFKLIGFWALISTHSTTSFARHCGRKAVVCVVEPWPHSRRVQETCRRRRFVNGALGGTSVCESIELTIAF